ncbi:MAG: ATP-dependent helicase [Verrucomicrobiales bacterium]|nr:ATP-dependent helicase [Verrucomicrobiales bacterium]
MARDYTVKRVPKNTGSQIDYEKELNAEQFAAVTAPPGPSLVIAGAGSGKTRTLTYRVAYLLDKGVPAKNILLLTFTNKAAREMLERVEQLVPYDTRDLWGGTFHSIGNRILRRHAPELGWERNFSIMDRDDQKNLLGSVIAECEVDTKTTRFPKPDVVGDIFSLANNTGQSIGDILEARYSYFAHHQEAIELIEEAYEAKKQSTNSMDFDDLLLKPLRIFHEKPRIREQYQKQFEWVLVDEYQDTNAVQSELIDFLGAPQRNVMVVGDDAQSIYSWRGADFRNILDFPERYEGAGKYVIETNYRSVPEILTLANAAIAPNTEQFRKNLAPWRAEAEMLPALAPLQDPNTQAAFVAQRILELRDEGVELNEIAVLYRAHFHAMELQLELTNRGIPFEITSGLRFFEQAHIKDVAAFMKVIYNRRDEVSFKRIVKMLPGIGDKNADGLWRSWANSDAIKGDQPVLFSEILSDFKVPAKAKATWEQLGYTLDEIVDETGKPRKPAAMMPSILGGVYEDYMRSKFTNFDNRRQDLLQLERYAERFDELDEFLSQLSLLAGQDAADASKDEPDEEVVCLSSVHQAKGLEWRVVFVIWLAEGKFPSSRVLDEDAENETDKGLEEERRLFYVAVTRARDELYLTYPQIWHGAFDGEVIQRPSRFLEDIPDPMVEEWNIGAAW